MALHRKDLDIVLAAGEEYGAMWLEEMAGDWITKPAK